MANNEEPTDKPLMASSSSALTSEDSVKSNLVILMVESGASGHYFDNTIICDLKQRLQDYVHFTTPRKMFTAGTAMRKACCKALSLLITATESLFGSISWWSPGLGATCFR